MHAAVSLSQSQYDRLPRRVQQELDRLASSMEHWKARATAGPESSDTYVRRSYDDGGRQYLGRGERVIFEGPRGSFEVHVGQKSVEVLSADGADTIAAIPRSSNRIELVTIDQVAEILSNREARARKARGE